MQHSVKGDPSRPLRAENFAAFRAAGGDHAATADSGHARAETVAAFTDELAGLVGTLHGVLHYSLCYFLKEGLSKSSHAPCQAFLGAEAGKCPGQ
jgi:hypothetical protein